MKLLVSIDANNVMKDAEGTYWCDTLHEYEFWSRYLEVFKTVKGATRVASGIDFDKNKMHRVDGPNVEIAEFPMKKGMKEYVLGFFSFKRAAKMAVKDVDCTVIRLPSVVGFFVLYYAKKAEIPIALEVVADPHEAYSTNKIAQKLFTVLLKKAALSAYGVSYVTKDYLQKIYPSRARLYGDTGKYFEANYSTINLPEWYFAEPMKYNSSNREITIIHTANGIHNYLKGHDILIKAVKAVRDQGFNVKLIIVGDGRMKYKFEELVDELGLNEHVLFTGLLSSQEEVRSYLQKSDLFVFPTKTEGLSRSLLEAMAVGLPCISTPVGGNPELLDKEYTIDPKNIQGFAAKIIELIQNPNKMEESSKKNIEVARNYRVDKITEKRNDFYKKLRKIAEKG